MAAGLVSLLVLPVTLAVAAELPDATAFDGVSCPEVNFCEAVGYYSPTGQDVAPVAEQWDGTSWSAQSVPTPNTAKNAYLLAVSCATATSCMAVGNVGGKTLAESWDGTEWSIQATANPSYGKRVLTSVSCASAYYCEASGSITQNNAGNILPLAEGWNGTAWTVQTLPVTNQREGYGTALEDVALSCLSTTDCEAVGWSYWPTSQHNSLEAAAWQWNGTKWKFQQTPVIATTTDQLNLESVSCQSGECVAIGWANLGSSQGGNPSPNVPFGEVWNGTQWSVTQPQASNPVASYDYLVSCPQATNCEAIGSDSTNPYIDDNALFSDTYTGTDPWPATQSIPPPVSGDYMSLRAISCPQVNSCEAVGTYTSDVDGDYQQGRLAMGWDGTNWTLQPS
jgi:hypothetical protein